MSKTAVRTGHCLLWTILFSVTFISSILARSEGRSSEHPPSSSQMGVSDPEAGQRLVPITHLKTFNEQGIGNGTRLNLVSSLVDKPAEGPSLDSVADGARAISLASGDLTGDGLPDLICGFEGADGSFLAILEANMESLYPATSEAYRQFQEGTFNEPFFRGRFERIPLPVAPNFIASGDFDGDQFADILVASRDDDRIFLIRNSAQHTFEEPLERALPGRPTALVTGEINRWDGSIDFAVAVSDGARYSMMVFEWPGGAWKAEPEVFDLSEPAAALSLARLDDDSWIDLAVASSTQVSVIHGRDRRLSLGSVEAAAVNTARTSEYHIEGRINSMTAANLSGGHRRELALLLEDGSIRLLSFSEDGDHTNELLSSGSSPKMRGRGEPTDGLYTAGIQSVRLSGGSREDLLVLDTDQGKLDLFYLDPQSQPTNRSRDNTFGILHLGAMANLRAVLPMRLNPDALSDLVILSDASPVLTAITTEEESHFVVTSGEDEWDGNVDDMICATGPCEDGVCTGPCTWAAAIQQANKAGSTLITFAGGIGEIRHQEGGTTGGIAEVRIRVEGDPEAKPVFVTEVCSADFFYFQSATGSVIRNVEVLNSSIHLGDGNILEGSLVGVGSAEASHGCIADVSSHSDNVTIGGPAEAARNVVASGGMQISGPANVVQNNWIGLDRTGQSSIRTNGILVSNASNPRILNNVISSAQPAEPEESGLKAGVFVLASSGALVQGNLIGTGRDGSLVLGNDRGIAVFGDNATVGGPATGQGNLIVGSRTSQNAEESLFGIGSGIQVLHGKNVLIQGNQIGIASPPFRIGQGNGGSGIYVGPPTEQWTITDLMIGGINNPEQNLSVGNLISNSGVHGIEVITSPNTNRIRILGNTIGASNLYDPNESLDQLAAASNVGAGVYISGSGHLIGGVESGAANTIAFNDIAGVQIGSSTEDSSAGNSIIGNRILENGSGADTQTGLGIDLAGDGVTRNDTEDGDTGPNDLLNFPELSLEDCTGGLCSTLKVTLDAPEGRYRFEIFDNESCDPSGFGEGASLLAVFDEETFVGGGTEFEAELTHPVPLIGTALTATVTRLRENGMPDATSEFSACAGQFPIVVNSTADEIPALRPGATSCDTGKKVNVDGREVAECTLRAAIELANSRPEPDEIRFQFPAGTPPLIQPLQALPDISEPVVIDGFIGQERVRLDGIEMPNTDPLQPAYGLTIREGSTVRGLTITRFGNPNSGNVPGAGIFLVGDKSASVIEGNQIGGDPESSLGNRVGIRIFFSPGNVIGGADPDQGNLIAGNRIGIHVDGLDSVDNRILGNDILDNTGDHQEPFPGGILLTGARDTTIGGVRSSDRCSGPCNLISGNTNGIIARSASETWILGNYIGSSANGTAADGNTVAGVTILGGSASIGAGIASGNLISGNGLGIYLAGGADSTVDGNLIGTDISGARAVPNLTGMLLEGAGTFTVGSEGKGNLISGNQFDGILVRGKISLAQIVGNRIGTDASGQDSLPNGSSGVAVNTPEVTQTAAPTKILDNLIAFNGKQGIELENRSRALIIGNRIHSNIGLGIQGGTQPSEILIAEAWSSGFIGVGGHRKSPVTEFFASRECDPTGFGEGELPFGLKDFSTSNPTDVIFRADFRADLPPDMKWITMTSFDSKGTSSFSMCFRLMQRDPTQPFTVTFPWGVTLTLTPEDGTEVLIASSSQNPPRSVEPELELASEGKITPVGLIDAVLGSYDGPAGTSQAGPGTFTAVLEYPQNLRFDSFYNYGPTPDDPNPHSYEFLYDGQTGAEFLPDRIRLHFIDGARGDHDLTINGEVHTKGGPTLLAAPLYFPFDQVARGSFVGIAVTNLEEDPGLLQFNLFQEQGVSDLALPDTTYQILEGRNQFARLTTEIFPEAETPSGWIELYSTAQAGSFFQFGTGRQLDGSTAQNSLKKKLYFTRVFDGPTAYRGQRARTFLSLANPGITPIEVQITLRSDGQAATQVHQASAVQTVTIPSKGFFYGSASELFGVADINSGYITVEVIQGEGAIGFELVELQAEKTVIGLNAAGEGQALELYSAQLASVSGLFTNLNLINTGNSTRSVTITAVNSDGSNFGPSVVQSLAPGEQFSRDAADLFGSSASSQSPKQITLVGSLRVEGDGPGIVGDVIFGDSKTFKYAAALPLQTETFQEAVFNHVAEIPQLFFTGLAFYNPGAEDSQVTVEVFKPDGHSTGTHTATIAAGKRTSALVHEFVPEAREQIGGFVKISSSQPLIGQMLFGAFEGSAISLFSAVPPTEVPALLKADPNPIFQCDGSGLGSTTLRWDSQGIEQVEIRTGSADGPILTEGARKGSFSTGKSVTDGTTFVMLDKVTGEVLAQTRVRVLPHRCASNQTQEKGPVP